MRIALTGGLACGKSETGRLLAREGAAVLDTDAVTHALQKPGTAVFRAIVRRFGRDVLDRRGRLDRKKLGERVFGNPRERRALEAVVHPAVMAEVRRWMRARARRARAVVVIIPLLYEARLEKGWDAVLCVTAPRRQVLARLKARGLSASECRARLAAQMPPTEKAKRADFVIRNDGSLDDLTVKVRALWKQILREDG